MGGAAAGRHVVVTTGTASGKSLAFNLPVARRARCATRRRARSTSTRRRRSRRTRPARSPRSRCPGSARRSTTATRRRERRRADPPEREPRAHQPRHAPHRRAAAPRPLGRLPRQPRATSSSTRRTSTAASSARTSRTCCAGCAGSRAPTAPSRSFLLASATIANPGELAALADRPRASGRRRDAAPRAARQIAIWNPPLLDEELGTRASALGRGGATAGRARRARAAHDLLHEEPQGGGADPPLRRRTGVDRRRRAARAVPRRLHARSSGARSSGGSSRASCSASSRPTRSSSGSTSACSTRDLRRFPGTVACLRQKWGRAGRRGDGLAVSSPARTRSTSSSAPARGVPRPPGRGRDPRPRRARASSRPPARRRVRGAARRRSDATTLGPEALERAATPRRAAAGRARAGSARTGLPGGAGPAALGDADAFAVVDAQTGEVLGLVEASARSRPCTRARSTSTSGGSTSSASSTSEARRARRPPFDGDWYTQAQKETETAIEEPRASPRIARRRAIRPRLRHRAGDRLPAQGDRRRHDDRLGPARPAPSTSRPRRSGSCLTDALLEADALPTLLCSLHAAEHAQIAVLPLLAMCDRWDIGGLSTNLHPQTGRPTIFIYDGHPGGVGITERGFDRVRRLGRRRASSCAAARASDGCPSCVQSPKCGNLNEPLDKGGALALLRRMLASGSVWAVDFGEAPFVVRANPRPRRVIYHAVHAALFYDTPGAWPTLTEEEMGAGLPSGSTPPSRRARGWTSRRVP